MASYEKFNYIIRPAKQVERKLLVEGLHKLGAGGFSIRDYRYIGFGSPFYADFVLFHKYLYIEDMLCVEHDPIRQRMMFNKPFPKVELHMGEISEVISTVDREKRHIVWLDYDYPLVESVLNDAEGFASTLAPGSIFMVTVEADPRLFETSDLPDELKEGIRIHRYKKVNAQVGRYIDGGVKKNQITMASLPTLYATVLANHLHDALLIRQLQFIPLFNFVYADGRQMLTIGGMFGTAAHRRDVKRSGLYSLPFITEKLKPISVTVPPLTMRERLWLDQHPASPSKHFEVTPDVVRHYRKYYRHYPNYFEALF